MNPDIHLAFDVGHSSIGWAVLQTRIDHPPALLGCGAVVFPADDCLASQRRQFRRQRRHIRATRLRIARLRRLLEHLGVLKREQLEAGGCAWPWLLAARVLRGGEKLTWSELWDVLRWYAHNRGYDGNKGWSRQDAVANDEDTEKEKKAHELLDGFAAKHGRSGTMAEVFCDVLQVDPLGPLKASRQRVRNLHAAFPREGVEVEVERILRAHFGTLPHVDEAFVSAIMRDHTKLPGPDYHLPSRYGQRLADGSRSPGGLLFGQLVPRFDNRIIARCPITFERIYQRVKTETGDDARATHEAEKLAKVPNADCAEFYRFRWAMQLANVQIATGDARKTRRLSIEERTTLHAQMEQHGALTPGDFKKAVRALTGGAKDNLEQMLALPDADRSLVLDPARKRAASGVLGVLWPLLDERTRKHTLTNLRRGKAITVRALLAGAPEAQPKFDHWWDGEAMKKPRKGRKTGAEEAQPRSRDQALDEKHSLKPDTGRAPYTREVLREAAAFVLSTDKHPMDEDGPLYRSDAIRAAQLQRAIDEQTNNHLVRHRLKLLERLHADIIADPNFAAGDKARVARVTIEVNRDLKEMSGKTAQEQAKIQGQQTAQFRGVEKKLNAAYQGLDVHLGPGLIRKGRIAEDLGWTCPYTGATYDALDLLHRRVDKDHIIPRSQRPSDTLDSLVITFSQINKWKGNRTAVRFVQEEQGKPVPGRPNLTIKTWNNYEKDVKALETFKGHDDDQKRKWKRKLLLLLPDYVEKQFTPGDLTKTSQLVRLGAQALERHYAGLEKRPVITSLPGSVTGAVRRSWDLLGCLARANPLVLNAADLDDAGKPKVHRKTEIRDITHLHHALDACVIGFASLFLPRDGGAWELLVKRRLDLDEQRRARELFGHQVEISSEGQLRLADLPGPLKTAITHKLAERRVVQHLPREWGGLPTKETVWRVFDPQDPHRNARRLHRWLQEAKVPIPDPNDPNTTTVLLIARKRRGADEEESSGGKVFRDTQREWKWVWCEVERSKVLGLGERGDKKLRAIKAGKLIADNFGMALFPDAPKGAEKYRVIRAFRVWEQIARLREEAGGKTPPILRRGQLIRFASGAYAGRTWRVLGLDGNGRIRFFAPDSVRRIDKPENHKRLQITSLLKDGLEIIRAPLCGIASPMESEPDSKA